jgi:hypothetical protein
VAIWVVSTVGALVDCKGPSTESSFPSIFLGGISWVFPRAHKRWAPMLGSDSRRLLNSNEEGMET